MKKKIKEKEIEIESEEGQEILNKMYEKSWDEYLIDGEYATKNKPRTICEIKRKFKIGNKKYELILSQESKWDNRGWASNENNEWLKNLYEIEEE